MGPGALNGMFRRSIGYGAYTFGDEPKVAAPAAPATPAPPIVVVLPDKILGLDRKTIFYILGSIAVYKLLF